MQHDKILRVNAALNAESAQSGVTVQGWVRTRRDAKGFSFLEINDGSSLANLQAIVDENSPAYASLEGVQNGAAVELSGELVESPGKGQKWELKAATLKVFGEADQESYPLQKKRHSDEFLRSIAHLRARTNKYGAAFRLRSEIAHAIHNFFHSQGFFYVHTPILTGADCEGAGELFRVTTLPLGYQPTAGCAEAKGQTGQAEKTSAQSSAASVNGNGPSELKAQTACAEQNAYAEDFFGQESSLTVSGQLNAEALATALGRVYTFGPTFRAENSNTPRHAAEFWMIEPEAAFFDLQDNMKLGEDMVRFVSRHVLERCANDLDLFNRFVDTSLLERVEQLASNGYHRVSYREAIKILVDSGKKFEYPVSFGLDLQTEHERFLAEEHFKGPVTVYDYPKSIKAFYMRGNEDGETVAAMDMLVPRIGELIGGSQREERLDILETRIKELGQDPANYWWYLDLRRFGSVPHSGFGLGFERLVMLLTGISNIRDVIPFPRTPGSLEF